MGGVRGPVPQMGTPEVRYPSSGTEMDDPDKGIPFRWDALRVGTPQLWSPVVV